MIKKIFLLAILFVSSLLPAFSSDCIEFKNDGSGVLIVKVPLKNYKNKIVPYVANELTTASDVFEENNFELVVNGGFFDPKTAYPISKVVINEREIDSIDLNPALIESLKKQGRYERVLDRSELRIYENKNGSLSFDITEGLKPASKRIKHSLQAGPMLIPNLRLEEEGFTKQKGNKTIDVSCDVLKRRQRTVIGLKNGVLNNDYLYIIIFSSDKKVALNEARDYCLKLGLDKAMALDGGSSTSMNYKDVEVVSDFGPQRKVRSFLTIEKGED